MGHIALDTRYPEIEPLNLEVPTEATIWIKSLYISSPLRSVGLGRAAMDKLEAMATNEPLSARTLMLDTMQKDDQKAFHPDLKVGIIYEFMIRSRNFRSG